MGILTFFILLFIISSLQCPHQRAHNRCYEDDFYGSDIEGDLILEDIEEEDELR